MRVVVKFHMSCRKSVIEWKRINALQHSLEFARLIEKELIDELVRSKGIPILAKRITRDIYTWKYNNHTQVTYRIKDYRRWFFIRIRKVVVFKLSFV